MDRRLLTTRIKHEAGRLGFDLVGVTAVSPSEHAGFLRAWLDRGHHGEMDYLARADAIERRADPGRAWPELRSAIVLGLNYYAEEQPGSEARGAAVIARYARGRDYHKVIKKKLQQLLHFIEGEVGKTLPAARAYVDTGPVLERELARRAGLGWFGRNTMLVNPKQGSYFFLAALLVECELEADAPFEADHCGTCAACVQACPTGALLGRNDEGAPVINATRCISYLTIEQRGPIPRELRPLIGNRIFGCDICQEVCPFSRKFSRLTSEPSFAARGPGEPPFGVEALSSDASHPGTVSPSLIDLMVMNEAAWESFSRGSALRRAGRAGFLRNVAVALGNWGSPDAVPVLSSALADAEPLVRGHAAWALGRIASTEAFAALTARSEVEPDPFVRDELERALSG